MSWATQKKLIKQDKKKPVQKSEKFQRLMSGVMYSYTADKAKTFGTYAETMTVFLPRAGINRQCVPSEKDLIYFTQAVGRKQQK